MGTRGPAPTPQAVLAARGSWRANVAQDDLVPAPEPGIGDPPDWLDEEARQAWSDLSMRLLAMNVLGTIDWHALALYCQLWSRWRKAEDFVARHGDSYVVKDDRGEVRGVRLYPQVKLAGQLAEQLTRLGRELGLSPSARTRVRTIPMPRGPSKLDKFLNAPPPSSGPPDRHA